MCNERGARVVPQLLSCSRALERERAGLNGENEAMSLLPWIDRVALSKLVVCRAGIF